MDFFGIRMVFIDTTLFVLMYLFVNNWMNVDLKVFGLNILHEIFWYLNII